jgi:hypothetical protein
VHGNDLTNVGRLNLGAPVENTISNGAITVTNSFHRLDTEGDAPVDDLTTINGGSTGDLLLLTAVSNDRDIVVKPGIGNIDTAGGRDVLLWWSTHSILLWYDGTSWVELSGRYG